MEPQTTASSIVDVEDMRPSPANDLENQANVSQSDGEVNSEASPASEGNNTAEKDFPALAPSKSMDFPDGALLSVDIAN